MNHEYYELLQVSENATDEELMIALDTQNIVMK